MVIVERRYFCSLDFTGLSDKQMTDIESLASANRLKIDLNHKTLEFSYTGNDTSRFIVRFFFDVASIVGEARGEIQCENGVDEGDDFFEFYSIRDGALYRQLGYICRHKVERVILDY